MLNLSNKKYKMKYWVNPSSSEFDFDQIRAELSTKFAEERYSNKPILEGIHDFEQENPFQFQRPDLDNPKIMITLNVYLQRNKKNINQPRGVVIMNHGLNSHIQRFKQIAHYLANQGFDVIGFDTRGFGKSQGYQGFVQASLDYHIEDNIAFFKLVDQYYQKHKNLPKFGFGASFGGLIMIHTAIAMPNYFKGLMLMAPALMNDTSQQKLMKKILPIISWFTGRWNIPIPNKGRNSCKNPRALEENIKDKGMYAKTKPLSLYNAVNLINKHGLTNIDKLTTPFVLFHGTVDKLVDLEGAFKFCELAKNLKDKTLIVVEELWHAICLDQEIYEIEDIIKEWLYARTA